MNYWLHPEAQEDLREAAEFYREQAGTALSQSFLAEFEYCVGLLLQYPHLGATWRRGKRPVCVRDASRLALSMLLSAIKSASSRLRTIVVGPATGAPGSRVANWVPDQPTRWIASGELRPKMYR